MTADRDAARGVYEQGIGPSRRAANWGSMELTVNRPRDTVPTNLRTETLEEDILGSPARAGFPIEAMG